jgi:Xaa-Pro aminopeptidase
MLSGWAGHALPAGARPLAPPSLCGRRRAALSAAFPDRTLVVPAGRRAMRANDIEHPFRAASDFVWLTGWSEPGAVLVLQPGPSGHTATLFLRPRLDRSTPAAYQDRDGEAWVGRQPALAHVGAAVALFVRPVDGLAEVLRSAPTVLVRRGVDAAVDALVDGLRQAEGDAAASTADDDAELATELAVLRLRKDHAEVSALRDAVRTTVRGFEDVVAALPVEGGVTERWIEGTFARRARAEGNDVAYPVIAAGGPRACVLHWRASHQAVQGADLVLIDAGAESRKLYAADVTRTLPVSGRFSAPQREVYEAVLAAHDAALAACQPGVPFLEPHARATAELRRWLEAKGLAEHPGWERRYTVHRTSHMLGLDVHDCSAAADVYVAGTLEPGMVLTVEPGLYFHADDLTVPAPYRGIGVRIEDDVLITESGHEVLTAALPTGADEVEAWMATVRGG